MRYDPLPLLCFYLISCIDRRLFQRLWCLQQQQLSLFMFQSPVQQQHMSHKQKQQQ